MIREVKAGDRAALDAKLQMHAVDGYRLKSLEYREDRWWATLTDEPEPKPEPKPKPKRASRKK